MAYNVIIGFNRGSSTTPVENKVIASARHDAGTASVLNFLRKKESRKSRRQMSYSNTFGMLFRSAATQLRGVVLQVAEYWLPKELEADSGGSYFDCRKKLVLDMSRSPTRIFSQFFF